MRGPLVLPPMVDLYLPTGKGATLDGMAAVLFIALLALIAAVYWAVADWCAAMFARARCEVDRDR